MTGRTLIIELHGYRSVSRVGGPLGMATTFGFVTVSWCPFLVSEWIRARVQALKAAVSGDEKGTQA